MGGKIISVWPYSHIRGMVNHMKTTLNIDEGVMRRLKQEAAKRGSTMSELVESAIRRLLDEPKPKKRVPLLPTFRSGGHLVNIDDRDALYGAMDSN